MAITRECRSFAGGGGAIAVAAVKAAVGPSSSSTPRIADVAQSFVRVLLQAAVNQRADMAGSVFVG